MFSYWVFGIYRSTRMTTLVEEFQTLFRSAALGLLVVASIGFFVRELYFGRFVVVACVGLNFFLQDRPVKTLTCPAISSQRESTH
jgi:hypothetical protein